jgi:hypothetical protein
LLKIEKDNWYSEVYLRTYGIDEDALALARKNQELPCRDLGKGVRFYLGHEILAWFEKHRVGPREQVPA